MVVRIIIIKKRRDLMIIIYGREIYKLTSCRSISYIVVYNNNDEKREKKYLLFIFYIFLYEYDVYVVSLYT